MAELYCTLSPCIVCARLILSADITHVIYRDEYSKGGEALELLRNGGVVVNAA
jgi:dCMP deaminase